MSSETIFVAGRYNKYLRNLSQSPWIDKNDVRIKSSVQELIEEALNEFLKFETSVFSSSGREDVDVRMLGRGRPFVFKLLGAQETDSYNSDTMSKIQEYIKENHKGKIAVRDLQVVTKEDVLKHIKAGEESKTKDYRALCCCSRMISDDDIQRVNALKNLSLDQKTPIRVLHRRSLTSRARKILNMNMERVKTDEFVTVKDQNVDKVFTLSLSTEAGTYIKEFVHGDFGRTTPNLSSILGECDTDLIELDVMEVCLDWPPSLS